MVSLSYWQCIPLSLSCSVLLSGVFSWLTLIPAAIAADGAAPAPPFLLAAPVETPPTIDGLIDKQEWARAACVSGFVTLGQADLAAQRTVVFVTYDDRNLYIAYDCSIPGGRPNAGEVERDGAVWGGDSVELSIAPPWMAEGQYYHFIGNFHGSVFDAVKLDASNPKGLDASWNGDWTVGNNVWEGVWSIELAVPLSDLRVQDPRGRWRMNFGRSEGVFTSWSFTGRGYHNAQAFGTVEFGDFPVVPRVSLIEGVKRGDLRVEGRFLNRAAVAREVVLEAALRKGGDETAGAVRERSVTRIAAGQAAELVVERLFEDRALNRLAVEARSGEMLLYRAVIPFSAAAPGWVSLHALPDEREAWLSVDLRRVKDVRRVDLHGLVANAAGAQVGTFEWLDMEARRIHGRRLDVAKWGAEGPLRVAATLCRAGTPEAVRRESLEFTPAAEPEWRRAGRALGRLPLVPAPWTAVEHETGPAGPVQALSVWGRRFVTGDSPLFDRIASAGEELLSGPVSLAATIGGTTHRFKPTGRELISESPDALSWRTRGRAGAVAAIIECTAEFDGMVKAVLTVESDVPVRLEGLVLTIPLRSESGQYYHLSRSYYNSAEAGLVPEDGIATGFMPYVWVGSLKRGLMWFAESAQGWHTGKTPIRITPGGDATELSVAFVDRPVTLAGTRRIVFGLQPTPVKPMPSGWRGWILGGRFDDAVPLEDRLVFWRMQPIDTGTNRNYVWRDPNGTEISVGHTTPLKLNVQALKKAVDEDHRRGILSIMYEYLGGASVGRTTGFDRYVDEWEKIPRKKLDYGKSGFIHGACLGSSWADFLLYGMKTLTEETGMDGVYWDGGSGPSLCRNETHGHGWYPEGSRRPEGVFPVFAARDFQKRLARMYQTTKGAGKYLIWNHNSQCMPLPMLSFSTGVLDGESPFQKVRDGGPRLPELVSLDYLRVMATGEHWGIVPSWLVYYRPGDPSVLRATYAVILPHGTPVYPLGGVPRSAPDADLTLRTWRALAGFGIGQAEFRGYWEQPEWLAVSPAHERILCTVYVRASERRILLILSNLQPDEESITVALAPKEAPCSLTQAHDLLRDEALPLAGGLITTTVGPDDYRLIEVK